MAGALLVDTDVLIEYSRGESAAVACLESLSAPFLLSAVTLAGLYTGVREGAEREKLDGMVAMLNAISVSSELAVQGGLIRRTYSPAHGTGLTDAIIVASRAARQ